MSLICLKLICSPSHVRIKSELILMVYEALRDLASARLSHFMSYYSPLPCSNLSTLTLFHLVMICPHWLFCFSDAGPPCVDVQVVQWVISGGHSVGCRMNDVPGNVLYGSPAHTRQTPSHCKALAPAEPSAWYVHLWVLCMPGFLLSSTQQIFHKARLYTRQNWLPNLQSPR